MFRDGSLVVEAARSAGKDCFCGEGFAFSRAADSISIPGCAPSDRLGSSPQGSGSLVIIGSLSGFTANWSYVLFLFSCLCRRYVPCCCLYAGPVVLFLSIASAAGAHDSMVKLSVKETACRCLIYSDAVSARFARTFMKVGVSVKLVTYDVIDNIS